MCKDTVSRPWYDFLSNLKQEEAEGNCVQVWTIDVTISLCCYLMSSGWTVVQERSYIRMGSCPVGQFTKKVIVICGCAINKKKYASFSQDPESTWIISLYYFLIGKNTKNCCLTVDHLGQFTIMNSLPRNNVGWESVAVL